MSPATTRDTRPRRTVRSASLSSLSDANHSVDRRRARPLHRRTDHSVIERRRREKINERLLHLQYMVPACRDQAREHFRRKMQDDSDQHIQHDLALEKLCIISHTVGKYRFPLITRLPCSTPAAARRLQGSMRMPSAGP